MFHLRVCTFLLCLFLSQSITAQDHRARLRAAVEANNSAEIISLLSDSTIPYSERRNLWGYFYEGTHESGSEQTLGLAVAAEAQNNRELATFFVQYARDEEDRFYTTDPDEGQFYNNNPVAREILNNSLIYFNNNPLEEVDEEDDWDDDWDDNDNEEETSERLQHQDVYRMATLLHRRHQPTDQTIATYERIFNALARSDHDEAAPAMGRVVDDLMDLVSPEACVGCPEVEGRNYSSEEMQGFGQVQETLTHILENGNVPPETRHQIMRQLGNRLENLITMDQAGDQARNLPTGYRERAGQLMSSFLPVLTEGLGADQSPQVRREALRSLGAFQVSLEQTPELFDTLRDSQGHTLRDQVTDSLSTLAGRPLYELFDLDSAEVFYSPAVQSNPAVMRSILNGEEIAEQPPNLELTNEQKAALEDFFKRQAAHPVWLRNSGYYLNRGNDTMGLHMNTSEFAQGQAQRRARAEQDMVRIQAELAETVPNWENLSEETKQQLARQMFNEIIHTSNDIYENFRMGHIARQNVAGANPTRESLYAEYEAMVQEFERTGEASDAPQALNDAWTEAQITRERFVFPPRLTEAERATLNLAIENARNEQSEAAAHLLRLGRPDLSFQEQNGYQQYLALTGATNLLMNSKSHLEGLIEQRNHFQSLLAAGDDLLARETNTASRNLIMRAIGDARNELNNVNAQLEEAVILLRESQMPETLARSLEAAGIARSDQGGLLDFANADTPEAVLATLNAQQIRLTLLDQRNGGLSERFLEAQQNYNTYAQMLVQALDPRTRNNLVSEENLSTALNAFLANRTPGQGSSNDPLLKRIMDLAGHHASAKVRNTLIDKIIEPSSHLIAEPEKSAFLKKFLDDLTLDQIESEMKEICGGQCADPRRSPTTDETPSPMFEGTRVRDNFRFDDQSGRSGALRAFQHLAANAGATTGRRSTNRAYAATLSSFLERYMSSYHIQLDGARNEQGEPLLDQEGNPLNKGLLQDSLDYNRASRKAQRGLEASPTCLCPAASRVIGEMANLLGDTFNPTLIPRRQHLYNIARKTCESPRIEELRQLTRSVPEASINFLDFASGAADQEAATILSPQPLGPREANHSEQILNSTSGICAITDPENNPLDLPEQAFSNPQNFIHGTSTYECGTEEDRLSMNPFAVDERCSHAQASYGGIPLTELPEDIDNIMDWYNQRHGDQGEQQARANYLRALRNRMVNSVLENIDDTLERVSNGNNNDRIDDALEKINNLSACGLPIPQELKQKLEAAKQRDPSIPTQVNRSHLLNDLLGTNNGTGPVRDTPFMNDLRRYMGSSAVFNPFDQNELLDPNLQRIWDHMHPDDSWNPLSLVTNPIEYYTGAEDLLTVDRPTQDEFFGRVAPRRATCPDGTSQEVGGTLTTLPTSQNGRLNDYEFFITSENSNCSPARVNIVSPEDPNYTIAVSQMLERDKENTQAFLTGPYGYMADVLPRSNGAANPLMRLFAFAEEARRSNLRPDQVNANEERLYNIPVSSQVNQVADYSSSDFIPLGGAEIPDLNEAVGLVQGMANRSFDSSVAELDRYCKNMPDSVLNGEYDPDSTDAFFQTLVDNTTFFKGPAALAQLEERTLRNAYSSIAEGENAETVDESHQRSAAVNLLLGNRGLRRDLMQDSPEWQDVDCQFARNVVESTPNFKWTGRIARAVDTAVMMGVAIGGGPVGQVLVGASSIVEFVYSADAHIKARREYDLARQGFYSHRGDGLNASNFNDMISGVNAIGDTEFMMIVTGFMAAADIGGAALVLNGSRPVSLVVREAGEGGEILARRTILEGEDIGMGLVGRMRRAREGAGEFAAETQRLASTARGRSLDVAVDLERQTTRELLAGGLRDSLRGGLAALNPMTYIRGTEATASFLARPAQRFLSNRRIAGFIGDMSQNSTALSRFGLSGLSVGDDLSGVIRELSEIAARGGDDALHATNALAEIRGMNVLNDHLSSLSNTGRSSLTRGLDVGEGASHHRLIHNINQLSGTPNGSRLLNALGRLPEDQLGEALAQLQRASARGANPNFASVMEGLIENYAPRTSPTGLAHAAEDAAHAADDLVPRSPAFDAPESALPESATRGAPDTPAAARRPADPEHARVGEFGGRSDGNIQIGSESIPESEIETLRFRTQDGRTIEARPVATRSTDTHVILETPNGTVRLAREEIADVTALTRRGVWERPRPLAGRVVPPDMNTPAGRVFTAQEEILSGERVSIVDLIPEARRAEAQTALNRVRELEQEIARLRTLNSSEVLMTGGARDAFLDTRRALIQTRQAELNQLIGNLDEMVGHPGAYQELRLATQERAFRNLEEIAAQRRTWRRGFRRRHRRLTSAEEIQEALNNDPQCQALINQNREAAIQIFESQGIPYRQLDDGRLVIEPTFDTAGNLGTSAAGMSRRGKNILTMEYDPSMSLLLGSYDEARNVMSLSPDDILLLRPGKTGGHEISHWRVSLSASEGAPSAFASANTVRGGSSLEEIFGGKLSSAYSRFHRYDEARSNLLNFRQEMAEINSLIRRRGGLQNLSIQDIHNLGENLGDGYSRMVYANGFLENDLATSRFFLNNFQGADSTLLRRKSLKIIGDPGSAQSIEFSLRLTTGNGERVTKDFTIALTDSNRARWSALISGKGRITPAELASVTQDIQTALARDVAQLERAMEQIGPWRSLSPQARREMEGLIQRIIDGRSLSEIDRERLARTMEIFNGMETNIGSHHGPPEQFLFTTNSGETFPARYIGTEDGQFVFVDRNNRFSRVSPDEFAPITITDNTGIERTGRLIEETEDSFILLRQDGTREVVTKSPSTRFHSVPQGEMRNFGVRAPSSGAPSPPAGATTTARPPLASYDEVLDAQTPVTIRGEYGPHGPGVAPGRGRLENIEFRTVESGGERVQVADSVTLGGERIAYEDIQSVTVYRGNERIRGRINFQESSADSLAISLPGSREPLIIPRGEVDDLVVVRRPGGFDRPRPLADRVRPQNLDTPRGRVYNAQERILNGETVEITDLVPQARREQADQILDRIEDLERQISVNNLRGMELSETQEALDQYIQGLDDMVGYRGAYHDLRDARRELVHRRIDTLSAARTDLSSQIRENNIRLSLAIEAMENPGDLSAIVRREGLNPQQEEVLGQAIELNRQLRSETENLFHSYDIPYEVTSEGNIRLVPARGREGSLNRIADRVRHLDSNAALEINTPRALLLGGSANNNVWRLNIDDINMLRPGRSGGHELNHIYGAARGRTTSLSEQSYYVTRSGELGNPGELYGEYLTRHRADEARTHLLNFSQEMVEARGLLRRRGGLSNLTPDELTEFGRNLRDANRRARNAIGFIEADLRMNRHALENFGSLSGRNINPRSIRINGNTVTYQVAFPHPNGEMAIKVVTQEIPTDQLPLWTQVGLSNGEISNDLWNSIRQTVREGFERDIETLTRQFNGLTANSTSNYREAFPLLGADGERISAVYRNRAAGRPAGNLSEEDIALWQALSTNPQYARRIQYEELINKVSSGGTLDLSERAQLEEIMNFLEGVGRRPDSPPVTEPLTLNRAASDLPAPTLGHSGAPRPASIEPTVQEFTDRVRNLPDPIPDEYGIPTFPEGYRIGEEELDTLYLAGESLEARGTLFERIQDSDSILPSDQNPEFLFTPIAAGAEAQGTRLNRLAHTLQERYGIQIRYSPTHAYGGGAAFNYGEGIIYLPHRAIIEDGIDAVTFHEIGHAMLNRNFNNNIDSLFHGEVFSPSGSLVSDAATAYSNRMSFEEVFTHSIQAGPYARNLRRVLRNEVAGNQQMVRELLEEINHWRASAAGVSDQAVQVSDDVLSTFETFGSDLTQMRTRGLLTTEGENFAIAQGNVSIRAQRNGARYDITIRTPRGNTVTIPSMTDAIPTSGSADAQISAILEDIQTRFTGLRDASRTQMETAGRIDSLTRQLLDSSEEFNQAQLQQLATELSTMRRTPSATR